VNLAKLARITAMTAVGVVALAACGSSSGTSGGSSSSSLSGSINVDGSSTVGPMTQVAAELFNADNKDVKITVGISGTGGGFEKFCAGETDMNDASRPIEDTEAAACKKSGVTYQQLVVANDALTVVVNKSNTWAKCLTTAQLKKIWAPKSTINNWNQVDSSYPNEPLTLFGPDTDSGTFDYFTGVINGEEGSSRTDYSPSSNDNNTVNGVAGDKGGMGYFGYTYYEQNQDKLNAVAINDGNGCVAPSVTTAQDGTYTPLTRPLFIYPSVQAGQSNDALMAFVQFYADNDASIAQQGQFIPLSGDQKTKLTSDLTAYQTAVGSSSSP